MYDAAEESNQDGLPIELYEFRAGNLPEPWRYCSGVRDQVWRGKTYEAIAISNDGITQTGEADNNQTVITLPDSLPLMQMFFDDPPTQPVRVIIRNRHGGTSPSAPIHLIAEVLSFGRRDAHMAALTVQQLTATFKRSGARMSWSRQCPHALYDKNCRVDKNDFKVDLTVSAVERGSIYSDHLNAVTNGYLDNGFIQWTNSHGIVQTRAIEHNRANRMTMFGRISGIYPGMVLSAFPGCSRTSRYCDEVFDNIDNYGGVPQMSGKSPFQGDPIW